ncbi:hypothetical protein D9611_010860 [Ephemerocybe angulata]|uniref:Uncharacterized protein n=1 Tax=Ephemerocybe angulata TaxID=980116 RepID=A0A8H5FFR7_9AGAR|nr:hypothetical protein D9611_010860 [Tulosesus angulatus]
MSSSPLVNKSTLVYNQIISFSPTKTPFKTPKGTKRKDNDENLPPGSCSTFSSRPSKKIRFSKPKSTSSVPPLFFPHRDDPPDPVLCSKCSDPVPPTKPTSKRYSTEEKLDMMLQALEDCHWKLSHFLHAISDHTTRGGRGARHAQVMSAFLQGRGTYTPIEIIDLWVRSPDSRIAKNTNHAELMYSFSTPYKAIRPLRPAITSLAVQMTEVKLASEAKKAVKPDAGLHATLRVKGAHKADLLDIGSSTFAEIGALQLQVQPVASRLLSTIAGGTTDIVRKRRPVETVVINALSTLNFTRNNEARLLPLMKGLLYFAHSAPVDLISYNSRTGDMPAYTTIYKAVKHLGKQESAATLARGRDPKVVGVIQFDNVQNYTKQRDHRVGRVNHMNIGMAGTFYELEDVNVEALSLESKQELVAKKSVAIVICWPVEGVEEPDTVLEVG